jgi:hypothetical protein
MTSIGVRAGASNREVDQGLESCGDPRIVVHNGNGDVIPEEGMRGAVRIRAAASQLPITIALLLARLA